MSSRCLLSFSPVTVFICNIIISLLYYTINSILGLGNISIPSIYCLLFGVKKFHVFHGLLHNCKNFEQILPIWILWKLIKAGNWKRFFRNEGKGMKEWNFSSWIISNIRHLAMLETAISISQTLSHFNNIACVIYCRIYCHIMHNSTLQYNALNKFVSVTTSEIHRFIPIEWFHTRYYCYF